MNVIRKAYNEILKTKLTYAPAAVLVGARQVGKTTLALNYAKQAKRKYLYLDMENPEDLAKIADNQVSFLNYHKDKLVIIDEVQAYPALYNSLRSVIDQHKQKGRFILLGSASPLLIKGISETLAGRTSLIDLSPFTLSEIQQKFSLEHHWLNGGFPLSFLANNNSAAKDWLGNFIRSYVERDLNILFDKNFNPVLSRRLWTMLAHFQGSVLNTNNLSRSLGVTAPVVTRYMQYLEGAFLLHRLLPLHINTKKRLVKSPKIYIKDTGILHFFSRINTYEDLLSHPIVGASWEGYVIEQILYHKPVDVDLHFYGTHNGSEIDLIMVKAQKPLVAIEIKFSNTPKVSKGFHIACNDLGITKKYVLTPHADTYPTANQTMVMSLWNFLKTLTTNSESILK